MAQTPFSLLLLRRLCLSSKNPKPHFTSFYYILPKQPFSTSPLPTPNSNSTPLDSQTKPSSLSARMSFIFDQIDQMEKQKQDNDQTLQRIRAWRQSREQQQQTQEKFSGARENQKIDDDQIQQEPVTVFKTQQNPEVGTSVEDSQEMVNATKPESLMKGVELVHPWVEWIELMERLVKQNYFDHRRKDEDKMVNDLGLGEIVENDDVGIDFNDLKTVQTACVNFGKDRFDILRSLSRQDIQILVGYGCANTDKKVVFSSKLLRKHVHLDEGEVCSSCSLRSSCERAYLLTNKEDEARTIDIMRVLLAYGFDHVDGTVTNKSLLKQKSVKNVVRKLLHEIVKLSSVPIDPNLPPPVIKRPPPKVKQPPPPPKRRVGRDDVEMKKGDWLCPKCHFMNFAKNTVCLQCDAKRPKRQLLPGEWECPECNFLNYRRNMSCFHCDCKRPPDEFMENKMQETQRNPRKEPEKIARSEVSNAWNFDFDDDESDGADVAAFEYADSTARHEDSHLISQPHGGNLVDLEENFDKTSKNPRAQGVGFDDFDDFDDDVDSYEIDTQNDNNLVVKNASLNDFSDVEDIEGYNNNFRACSRPGRPARRKSAFSGSEDGDESDINTDDDISTHPNWKASHVANSRRRSNNRGQTGYSRGLSFGSDDEFALDDDSDDDLRSGQTGGRKTGFGRNSRSRADSGSEDDSFSGYGPNRSRYGGNKFEGGRRGSGSKGRGGYEFVRDTEFGSRGKMSTRGNSRNGGGLKRSSRGSQNKWETTNSGGDSRNFNGPKRGGGSGYGSSPRGRSYKYGEDNVSDSSEFRNSRRVIER